MVGRKQPPKIEEAATNRVQREVTCKSNRVKKRSSDIDIVVIQVYMILHSCR